jgi:hypothetical protein
MNAETRTIPGERFLKISDNGVLVLTNYRVKYDSHGQGASKFVTMSLDSVSSCGLVTQSRPMLLVLAAVALIAALLQNRQELAIILLIVAAVLAAWYAVTRSAVITISSPGGQPIVVPAKGMKRESILAFVEEVIEAKLRFLGRLPAETGR